MTSSSEQKAGLVMQQMHDDLASRAARRVAGRRSPREHAPRWMPTVEPLVDKDQYALQELLQFEGIEFVENAYRAILGRPADTEALRLYAQGLHNATITKLEILGALRWSTEGQRRGIRVHRLRLLWTLQRWKRKRLVGPFIEWGHTLARLPRIARMESVNAARNATETQRMGELLNEVAQSAWSHAAELERRLDEVATQLQFAESRAAAREESHGARLDSLQLVMESEFGPEVFRSIETAGEGMEPVVVRRPSLLLRLSALEERLEDDGERMRILQQSMDAAEAARSTLQQRIAVLDADMERLSADVQQSALSVSAEVAAVVPGPAEQEAAPVTPTDLDVMYAALEDSFRGSRELVKERVRPYLDDIRAVCGPPGGDALVIDIGCGRGEWLEMVRDAGYHARGIDMNNMFVQTCRALGLDVIAGDAFDVLRGMPAGSASAITSMHLVEHLPFETMIALIDECHRVLKPGGMLILETPNPENLAVGAFSFYMDPTHRNPIPPGLLFWLTRSRGFADVRIDRLTEARDVEFPELLDEHQPGARSINMVLERFQAPLDYAVLARKTA